MNTNVQMRRQYSLINLYELKKKDRRKFYSLNDDHYLNSLLCDLEWDEMDLVEMSEADTLSDYDIDECLKFNEFDFEMIKFHQEDTISLASSASSLSILKINKMISYDYKKSYYYLFDDILKTSTTKAKSVASLIDQNTKKYLCLKSKHSSLLNLNENIKYCLIKKQQKKKDVLIANIRFFRLNKIIIYFGRLINKFKSIIYNRKRQKMKNNVLLIDMIDNEILKSYDIID
jgi:hypothetical protein